MRDGKNDAAWAELFARYDIPGTVEREGCFEITAEQIIACREPRLMTKFDHSVQLPRLFSAHRLAILPVTRGRYVIAHFDAYHDFEPDSVPVLRAPLPAHLQSLDAGAVKSEAIALNCALASGIIEHFTGDTLLLPTVSGRMGSGIFDFSIRDSVRGGLRRVHVANAQIEIDAAYEGLNSLTLFEAKRDLSKDFLVRQLYYPFRAWRERVSKAVRTVFLVYSNGIYRMYEYAFQDPEEYSSLTLVRQRNYAIEDTALSPADIQALLRTVPPVPEPELPFPQADVFERVINLCELLSDRTLNRNEVTEQYDFDLRQTNYYTDAARYLGLLEKGREGGVPVYRLSEYGKRVLRLDYQKRQLALCRCILSHRVFRDVLQTYFRCGAMPDKREIVALMRRARLYQVASDETYSRRASTVRHWVEWILRLTGDGEIKERD